MFTITALPAAQGDALWIEYGKEIAPSRVIIDGGTLSTANVVRERIEALDTQKRRFDLLVVTHVDSDHIAGVVKLLNDTRLGVSFADVWFNGWPQIAPKDDTLGPVEGEFLSVLIRDRKYPWNAAFEGRAVVVPDDGPLPTRTLDGGLKLTLVSPTPDRLAALKPVWRQTVKEAGLDPGDPDAARSELAERARYAPDELGGVPVEKLAASAFKSDTTKPNGSSIALVADYEGKRCLLTGDGQIPVLDPQVERLLRERNESKLPLTALKMPHHGSGANISSEFLDKLDCDNYIFSSNGAVYGHPDREAIARVLKHGGDAVTLHFNYRTEFNKMWDSAPLRAQFGYQTQYAADEDGIVIRL